MGRGSARRMRAYRRRPGRGAGHGRAPRSALRGGESHARSKPSALRARAGRDEAELRQLLRALRPRALARAREDAAKRAAARRSRSAFRAPRGGIDQETARERGGRARRLRDLPAEIPVARIAAGLAARAGRRRVFPSSLEEGWREAPGWSAHSLDDPHVALHHVAGQVLERLLVAGRVVTGERLLQARELDQDHALIQPGFVYLRRVAAHEILAPRGLDRRRRELRVGLERILVLDRVITDNPIGLGHRFFLSLIRLDAEIPDDLTESRDVAPDGLEQRPAGLPWRRRNACPATRANRSTVFQATLCRQISTNASN